MALIEIDCTTDNLEEYFKRKTFTNVKNSVMSAYKTSNDITKKYFLPKYKNDLLFDGLRYEAKNYPNNSKRIFFDSHSYDLFFAIDEKTVMISHQRPMNTPNPKNTQLSKESRSLIDRKINRGRMIKGIEKIERDVISTLSFLYPLDAWQHKWIVDIEYGYKSEKFDYAGTVKGTIVPQFATIFEDRVVVLYAHKERDFIDRFNPKEVYRSNNFDMMAKIPIAIRRGDPIEKIYNCNKGIAVEKETGVTWFVAD